MDTSRKNNETIKYPVRAMMTKQEFTVVERRIVYIAMRQIKQGFGVQRNLFNEGFVLTIPYGVLQETNWERFKSCVKRLEDRKFILADNDVEYKAFRWVWRVDAVKNKGLKIHFTPNGALLLAELSKGYTPLNFNLLMSLNSEYSQRMYELLSRWKDVGVWLNVDIEELRELLNVPNSYNLGVFRKVVLNHCQKELSSKTDIKFTYELTKTGRRFTHIDFFIETQSNPEFEIIDDELIDENDQKSQRALDYLIKLGVVKKELQNKIIKEKQKEFWQWIYQWNTMPEKKRAAIKNPAGYLLKSLGVI